MVKEVFAHGVDWRHKYGMFRFLIFMVFVLRVGCCDLRAAEMNFPKVVASGGWTVAEIEAAQKLCHQLLQGMKIELEPQSPLGNKGGCGDPAPVRISSINGITINPPAVENCAMAEALFGWFSSSLQPSALELLGRRITVVHNATDYACRRRNGLANGKLSEHGRANALDISSLVFDDGSTTSIKGDWSGVAQIIGASAKGKFLRRIRQDACIRFSTVLGPGSDTYHADHFHVDLATRKNGFRLCK